MVASKNDVRLVVIQDGKPHEIRIGQELTIGRAYSNLLRLDSEEISRVHAVIYRREDRYVLRDLDSKNGVLLNGQRIVNSELSPDDHIQIGKFLLIFDPQVSNIKEISENFVTGTDRPVQPFGDTDSVRVLTPLQKGDLPSYVFSYEDIVEMLKSASSGQNDVVGTKLASFYYKMQGGGTEERSINAGVGDILLKNLANTLHASRGVIVTINEDGKTLSHAALFPYNREVAVNRVVIQRCIRQGYCIVCKDVRLFDEFKESETVRRDSIRSIIALPLKNGESTIGLLYLDTIAVQEDFEREDLVVALAASKLFSLFLADN